MCGQGGGGSGAVTEAVEWQFWCGARRVGMAGGHGVTRGSEGLSVVHGERRKGVGWFLTDDKIR